MFLSLLITWLLNNISLLTYAIVRVIDIKQLVAQTRVGAFDVTRTKDTTKRYHKQNIQ